MNVLITGSNGFIGSSYAARLRSEGGSRVLGIDLQEHSNGHCDDYVQLDLGLPAAGRVLRDLPAFDRVLHAGGVSGFMVETDNPQRIFDVNVAGTMHVLNMARTMSCKRVVLCSTVMVYGPQTDPSGELEESTYPIPISVYGGSKVAQEGLMHGFAGQYGVDAIALRFSHVYGPGRTTECFVRQMLTAVASGEPCRIPQASGSSRQYVHIDDVTTSIALAMRVAEPRERIFNISAGEIHTLAELAQTVQEVAGPFDVSFDEARDLPNYRIGKLAVRRARNELDYIPRYSLREGVRAYWATLSTAGRHGRTSP